MYLNAPKDVNMSMFTYLNTRSNTEADLDISRPGTEAAITVASFGYARIMSVFGRTGGPGFSDPYVWVDSHDTSTGQQLVALDGWGDSAFTFDVNLFGADAMTPEGVCFESAADIFEPALGSHHTVGRVPPRAARQSGRKPVERESNFALQPHDERGNFLVGLLRKNQRFLGPQRLSGPIPAFPGPGFFHWKATTVAI